MNERSIDCDILLFTLTLQTVQCQVLTMALFMIVFFDFSLPYLTTAITQTLTPQHQGQWINGAKITNLSPSTVTINQNAWDLDVISDKDQWGLWLKTDATWGFDSSLPSSFTLTLYGTTRSSPSDLLISFSDGMDTKYSTLLIKLNGQKENMIAPGCDSINNPTQPLMPGDVYYTMLDNPPVGSRECRPAYIDATNTCSYETLGPAAVQQWPLVFTIENYPIENHSVVRFESDGYFAVSCGFGESFLTNTGMNIWLTALVNDNYQIEKMELEYSILSPTNYPTILPSMHPTNIPSTQPTDPPTTVEPTLIPTEQPTTLPTIIPTNYPTIHPTHIPTAQPSAKPTTSNPTLFPTAYPATNPTKSPTDNPTATPPTLNPSTYPTSQPTSSPTTSLPTATPTRNPSIYPSISPIQNPTQSPTNDPSRAPSTKITKAPSTDTTSSISTAPNSLNNTDDAVLEQPTKDGNSPISLILIITASMGTCIMLCMCIGACCLLCCESRSPKYKPSKSSVVKTKSSKPAAFSRVSSNSILMSTTQTLKSGNNTISKAPTLINDSSSSEFESEQPLQSIGNHTRDGSESVSEMIQNFEFELRNGSFTSGKIKKHKQSKSMSDNRDDAGDEGVGAKTMPKKDTIDRLYGNKSADMTANHRLFHSADFTDVSSMYHNDGDVVTGMDQVLWEEKEDEGGDGDDIVTGKQMPVKKKKTMMTISEMNVQSERYIDDDQGDESDSNVLTPKLKNKISSHYSEETPGNFEV